MDTHSVEKQYLLLEKVMGIAHSVCPPHCVCQLHVKEGNEYQAGAYE